MVVHRATAFAEHWHRHCCREVSQTYGSLHTEETGHIAQNNLVIGRPSASTLPPETSKHCQEVIALLVTAAVCSRIGVR